MVKPQARLTDARDPVTAYLAKYTSLITESDNEQGVRLSTGHANGYLQALYDIHQIGPEVFERLKHVIEWTRQSRSNELAGLPELPYPGSPC